MMNESALSAVVLIVDDSPESLSMLNEALNAAGLTVLVALSGMQALAIVDKVVPDVVLMDGMMPEMDGFETCREIKQRLPDTPVIFMTGLTEVEDVVKGFDAGGVDYVTKPIKPGEVIARIRVHIANARLTLSAKEALDTSGQYIFCANEQGAVVWTTPQTRYFLDAADKNNDEFSASFQRELAGWLTCSGKKQDLLLELLKPAVKITCLAKQKDGEYLLRINQPKKSKDAAELRKHLPITKRESEVLYWLSHGKSNWEIAQILSMSPRTANKHLEQIFRKIEVDNRTAAAAISIRILGEDGV